MERNKLGSAYGNRCIGVVRPGGKVEVLVDESYYLRGGIRSEELGALMVHEIAELTSAEEDGHVRGVKAEYRWILDKFGIERLQNYHTRLCNLMGGDTSIRKAVLNELLRE